MHAERLGRAAGVVLVLLSGALMAWAGRLWVTNGVNTALFVSIVPGITIEAAYASYRWVDRREGRPRPLLGARVLQEGVGLTAGGVMALGGYAAIRWGWAASAPLLVAGLPLIAAAVILGRSRVVAGLVPKESRT